MANITDNAPILHFIHKLTGNHVLISRGSYHNIYTSDHLIQFYDTEAVHTVGKKAHKYAAGSK